jgi:hypothetical protein
MTDAELDIAYTQLCHTMTGLGQEQALPYLARFALLAMVRVGDLQAVQTLISQAGESLPQTA